MRNNKLERLDHPDGEDGVRVREWPLEQLTLEEVRARWGAGSYKAHWFRRDEENPQLQSGGHGPLFTLDPEVPTHVAPPAPTLPAPSQAVPIAQTGGGITADSLLTIVTSMMQISDKRAESTINAITALASRRDDRPSGPDPVVMQEMASLRAELAASNARAEAERERRALEERFREERDRMMREAADREAKLRAEADEAKRRAEAAEAEAERETRPAIEPGQPIMSQLGYGAANALMQKPEVAAVLIEKATPFLAALFGGGGAAQPASPPASGPPPTGAPAPKAVPAGPVVTPPPRVPVRPAAPVVAPPVQVDPATSSWQPIAAPPADGIVNGTEAGPVTIDIPKAAEVAG
jgi:hypothetical protein